MQAAREAARRTQCKNNLKNVGLALINYENTMGEFPPGIQFDVNQDPGRSDQFRPNWVILTLPFMEGLGLYDSFNFDLPISAEVNRFARGTRLPGFLCPTDSGADVPFEGKPNARRKLKPGQSRNHPGRGASIARGRMGEGDNWARGNYACNGINVNVYGATDEWSDLTKRGVMGLNQAVTIKQVLDGTSKTILAAEVRIGLTKKDRRGVWAMGAVGASALFWHGYGGDANGPNAPWANSDDMEGCIRVAGQVGAETMVRERMGCCLNANCQSSRQAGTRSQHPPGGVQVVFLDGHVQWIDDTINTTGPMGPCCSVWDRLIASADGTSFHYQY